MRLLLAGGLQASNWRRMPGTFRLLHQCASIIMPVESENTKRLLTSGAELLQLEMDEKGVLALCRYYDELLRWSKKINLIGKKQRAGQIIENHFLDSLFLLKALENAPCKLLDVGSGAGFPGLVCKAIRPELDVILIEPRLKRVSFLRHIIRVLDLASVEVIAARIEDVDVESISFTHITSRAVAEIVTFLQMVEPVVDKNSSIVCMKGPKWKQELDNASGYLEETGVVLTKSQEFVLPFSGAKRAILTFQRRKKP